LPKKVDEFGLAIPCYYIPNELVKAVSKIRIYWYQREILNNGGNKQEV